MEPDKDATQTLCIRTTRHGLAFDVRVTPNAGRQVISGCEAGRLKVKINAPPVEGAANAACIALLARLTGLKTNQFSITAGTRSRQKTVTVSDVSFQDLEDKLKALLSPGQS